MENNKWSNVKIMLNGVEIKTTNIDYKPNTNKHNCELPKYSRNKTIILEMDEFEYKKLKDAIENIKN